MLGASVPIFSAFILVCPVYIYSLANWGRKLAWWYIELLLFHDTLFTYSDLAVFESGSNSFRAGLSNIFFVE